MITMAAFLVCIYLTVFYVNVNGQSNHSTNTDVTQVLQTLREEYDTRIRQCEEKIDRLASEVKYISASQADESVRSQPSGCNGRGETDTTRNTRQTGPQPGFTVIQKVAFYAQLTYNMYGITDNQTIVFDGVETNIGNSYDSGTGLFTAPVSGTYVFIWTTTSYKNFSYLQSEIMVNGVIKGRQWSDSGTSNDVSSATGSSVLNLVAGDTVWIRTNSAHLGNTLRGGTLSSFSGWLLN